MYSWSLTTHKDRWARWFLMAMIVVIFLAVLGILMKAYLMSVVVILFAGVYGYIENNGDPVTSVEITDNLIRLNTNVYEFAAIERFWVLRHQGIPFALRVFHKKGVIRYFDIPFVSTVDAEEVITYLTSVIRFDPNITLTRSDELAMLLRL